MDVEATLEAWSKSLCPEVAVGALRNRNVIAQKWKAMFRSITLLAALFYRAHDLLTQSLKLHQQRHTLGARIILRSAFETVAVLIYLNQRTEMVLKGELDFHEFCLITSKLLAGSKDGSTGLDNVNVLTCLKHADMRYDGILNALQASIRDGAPKF